ncbi:hypothetical protein TNCT_144241 [Trichonephila clavata]|uniref:Uncharacterized protein n=1 Tax=Trichonephila clavata TaxID=2740835 RepID=A0A8X6ILA5_TRICU|nr:hypothetical protein TNCT_144241 [Trichonephila clavata]
MQNQVSPFPDRGQRDMFIPVSRGILVVLSVVNCSIKEYLGRLNKMMEKFESIGSLVSHQTIRRPTTAAAVTTAVETTVQSMSAVATHG